MRYLLISLFVVGCSVGPQLVPVTAVPVQETNVDIRACDGGTITITEFWIDGRSASRQRADTTGNEVESGDIDAGLSVEAEVTE